MERGAFREPLADRRIAVERREAERHDDRGRRHAGERERLLPRDDPRRGRPAEGGEGEPVDERGRGVQPSACAVRMPATPRTTSVESPAAIAAPRWTCGPSLAMRLATRTTSTESTTPAPAATIAKVTPARPWWCVCLRRIDANAAAKSSSNVAHERKPAIHASARSPARILAPTRARRRMPTLAIANGVATAASASHSDSARDRAAVAEAHHPRQRREDGRDRAAADGGAEARDERGPCVLVGHVRLERGLRVQDPAL